TAAMVLSGPAQTVRLAASSRSAGPGFFPSFPSSLSNTRSAARCSVLAQGVEQLRNRSLAPCLSCRRPRRGYRRSKSLSFQHFGRVFSERSVFFGLALCSHKEVCTAMKSERDRAGEACGNPDELWVEEPNRMLANLSANPTYSQRRTHHSNLTSHQKLLRMVRPSLIDPRFTGDPWIVDCGGGAFSLCLGDYCLAGISGVTIDLPSFNQVFDRLRNRRPRRLPQKG